MKSENHGVTCHLGRYNVDVGGKVIILREKCFPMVKKSANFQKNEFTKKANNDG